MTLKSSKITRLSLYLIGTFLAGFLFIQYPSNFNSAIGQTLDREDNQKILTELETDDVIYLAENHNSLEDHQGQLEIIQHLHQQNPDMAIAMEMFQRPFQSVLDRYLSGEINETELRQQTEYDTRWGYDWEYYAPIIRFAKVHQIPLLAINTPTEIIRKVAAEGLASLNGDDFRYIPPLAEINIGDREYRARMERIFNQHAHGEKGNSNGFDNFFAAQVLWDETMAEAIASFHHTNPQSQIIVLAGEGHINYGYGIPDRVARRILDNSFQQTSVLLGTATALESDFPQTSPTDFVWHF